jgi:hypothetical protein
MHALTENESEGTKDSFREELEHRFDQFPKYHMKILLEGGFSAKVGREDILNPTIWNESLHEINDNGVRVVNFATSKDLIFKSTMVVQSNIHKYTWNSSGKHTVGLITY